MSAVELALGSGALGLHRDAELVGLPHCWRETVHLFNRRLDLTAVSTFSNTISTAELAALRWALHREDSDFAATGSMLQELFDKLPRT